MLFNQWFPEQVYGFGWLVPNWIDLYVSWRKPVANVSCSAVYKTRCLSKLPVQLVLEVQNPKQSSVIKTAFCPIGHLRVKARASLQRRGSNPGRALHVITSLSWLSCLWLLSLNANKIVFFLKDKLFFPGHRRICIPGGVLINEVRVNRLINILLVMQCQLMSEGHMSSEALSLNISTLSGKNRSKGSLSAVKCSLNSLVSLSGIWPIQRN